MKHGKPDITEWSILGQDQMFTQFQIGPATRKQSRAVIQVVDAADI